MMLITPYLSLYQQSLNDLVWGIEDHELVTILSQSPAVLQDNLCDILFGNIRQGFFAHVYLPQRTYFDLLKVFRQWLWKEEARQALPFRHFRDFQDEARDLESHIRVNDEPNPHIDEIVYDAELLKNYTDKPFIMIDDFKTLCHSFGNKYPDKAEVLRIKEGLNYITCELLMPVIIHTTTYTDFNFYDRVYHKPRKTVDDFPPFMPLYNNTNKIMLVKETQEQMLKEQDSNAFFNWFNIKFFKLDRYIGETDYIKTNQDKETEDRIRSLQK